MVSWCLIAWSTIICTNRDWLIKGMFFNFPHTRRQKPTFCYYFRPSNKEELFNLRHSSLRNVVERTFGAWKKRFPILSQALDYSLDNQQDLLFVLAVVQKFSIDHAGVVTEDFFKVTLVEEGQNNIGNDKDTLAPNPVNLTN